MGSFLPLFNIIVEHSYPADGLCHDLDFVLAPWTEVMVRKLGLVLKKTNGGIRVFYDEDRLNVTTLFSDDHNDFRSFSFKVFSLNPQFMNFTYPSLYHKDAILHFDSRKASHIGHRLHKGEWAADEDFEPMTSPVFDGLFNATDRCRRPHFCITIRDCISPELSSPDQSPLSSPDWLIRFKARETYWKYLLVGELGRKDVYISDKNSEVSFECIGDTLLSDNRIAKGFVSESPLPIREKTDYNFQLREKGSGNGKVLIKRLPVASSLQIDRDVIKGVETAVSEIFIHC
jgi:hypothetical protein